MLHIHSPSWHHDAAYVVGTEGDLKGLRDLIDKVLANKSKLGGEFFTQDGEGFTTHVIMVKDCEEVEHKLPYTHEFAKDNRENAVHPVFLC